MAKYLAPAVLDGGLTALALATEMYACVGQPTDRAGAIAAKAHAAAITMAPGDFTLSGTTSRVATVAGKSVAANAAVNVDHVALCSGTTLLAVTTCPVQATNISGTITIPSFTLTDGPVS